MREHSTALSYAVRLNVVGKYFGQLCVVVTILTLTPFVVRLSFGELQAAFRYAILATITAVLGILLSRLKSPTDLQPNEAMVVVALLFLLNPFMMCYPLMLSGLGFIDAWFEAVSGVTTTGLTTLSSVEGNTAGFLFSRAWMQWYGGLGIVVLWLALTVRPGRATRALALVEGGQEEDLVGGTKARARRLLYIFGLLTLLGLALLLVLGIRPFDALLYTMAAVSTGGFSPYDNSLVALGSWSSQATCLLLSLAGAVPLSFYSTMSRSRRHFSGRALQIYALLVCASLTTTLLVLSMRFSGGTSWSEALFHAPILALSAQTTAGFSNVEVASLEPASKLALILAMLVGGGVGSTAGGIKVLRLLIVLRSIQLAVLRTSLSRHAVVKSWLGGANLGEDEIRDTLLLVELFAAVIVLSWAAFVVMGYPALDALFEVTSATATVGLSAGVTSPDLPTVLKIVLCVDMLMGRLEILAWFVLFYPGTWIGRRL